MRAPMSDRILRRIVADLAAAAPEDVDEVLAGLTADQAARVRALLADYLGAPQTPSLASSMARRAPAPVPPSPDAVPADPSVAGLSEWIVRRFEDPPQAGHRMTADARAALRACVAQVQPPSVPAPAEPAARPAAGWRERLALLVGGRGR